MAGNDKQTGKQGNLPGGGQGANQGTNQGSNQGSNQSGGQGSNQNPRQDNNQSGNRDNDGKQGTNQPGNQGNQGGNKTGSSQSDTSARGFASMDPNRQREIASEGGRAAHAAGTAHEFTSQEARAAGKMSHKNDGNQQSGLNQGNQGGTSGKK